MKLIEGYYWPDDVGIKYKASLTRVKSLKEAIRRCEKKNRTKMCIQAGGSYGVWPDILSEHFEFVDTFEPDSISFKCLLKNVPALNVVKANVALGAENKLVSLHRKSLTAHKIDDSMVGTIPMITIDSFDLAYDAILLDVEGYELKALQGAEKTIGKYKPLILTETGNNQNDIRQFLSQFGYNAGFHIELDDIYEAD